MTKMDSPNNQELASVHAPTEGEALIEELLGLVGGLQEGDERRQRDRYPICCKMQLMPIDELGMPAPRETIAIFGKDLSRRGICFSHDLPLTSTRFIISFVLGET